MVTRIASFLWKGRPTFGRLLDDDGLIDLGAMAPEGVGSLREALAANCLQSLVDGSAGHSADCHLSEIEFLPVICDPAKIFCIGANFPSALKPQAARPPYPVIFTRFRDTLTAHGAPLAVTDPQRTLDFEGEVAVVIGRAGSHIEARDAIKHVAGYACFNDATVRAFQTHSHQFAPAKNFPATAALGPAMVMACDIADHRDLQIVTRVNGAVMQNDGLRSMIFSIPEIIAYCSSFAPLAAGDIIACGAPDGFGASRNPPVYLRPGDWVEVEVQPIGVLVNPIVAG